MLSTARAWAGGADLAPEATDLAARGKSGGISGISNAMATRFLANADYSALVDTKKTALQASIYDSGDAQSYLDGLTTVLTEQASDLVSAETVTKEAAAISACFTS